jgi:DNA polymerase sigma
MQSLSDGQVKRQDFVDNEIYHLVKQLLPSTKEIEWNIEMIADIRDTIQHWLVDKYKMVNEFEFYP